MTRTTTKMFTLFDSVSVDGRSESMRVADYKFVTFKITGANNPDMTVFVYGDINNEVENPAVVPCPIGCYDYNTSLFAAGTTGVSVNTNGETLYTVNVDGIKWLQFEVANYVAGNVTLQVQMYNND